MLLEMFPCALRKFCVSSGFAKQIISILLILSYNGSLVSLTAAKFNPLIFSLSGFAFSYDANMFILMILYDFCLLPAQFLYIVVNTWEVESRVEIADRCAHWKISNGAENLTLQRLKCLELGM
jgi:hypothetical protein